ncbi:MAG: acyl-CoA thioesterase [Propioniciclava sp.]
MQTTEEILRILEVTRRADGRFQGRNPDTILQRTFGGQVMAQALSAVYGTVDHRWLAHSLKGYFLRAGHPHFPIDYHVTRARDGRTFTTRRVQAFQDDREIFVMTVSLKVDEPGLDHAETPGHWPDPPQSCVPLAAVLGRSGRRAAEMWEREFAAIDARFAGRAEVNGGSRMQVWLRTRDALPDDPRIHQMMLAYASDMTLLGVSTLPHPAAFGSAALQMATVDHSMWFHRPIRADAWVLYDQGSPNAANALGFSLGRLYDSTGVLGASTAQEGLIRLAEESSVG